MNIFTDVYSKSREILKTQKFDKGWDKTLDELKSLLASDGPDTKNAKVLDNVRDKLQEHKSWYQFANKYMAKEIVEASKADEVGFQERCALLKTIRHFYFVSKKGNQTIWVVDSPKKYNKWAYDQLQGLTKESMTIKLQESSEVFGEENRKMISDALQLARKWSAEVEIALSKQDKDLEAKASRWFHEGTPDDIKLKATIATLSSGFRKITAACNSGKVIFSDRPHLRASGDYDSTYASVNAGDRMPVIYVYELFLTTGKRTFFGNIPKLWLCALTVVHELSHKVCNTKDINYDDDGLKPGNNGFTTAKAIKNADSWAYFAADVVHGLSDATVKKVLV